MTRARASSGSRASVSAVVYAAVGRGASPAPADRARRARARLLAAGLDREAALAASTRGSRRTSSRSSASTIRDYEIVFSFAERSDPAYRGRAARRRPPSEGAAPTFVFDAREPGGNAKVNRLAAGVRARPASAAAVLRRKRPGAARLSRGGRCSFFADPTGGPGLAPLPGVRRPTLGSRLESLHLNGCLLPGPPRRADAAGCRASSASRSSCRGRPSRRSAASRRCATTSRRTTCSGGRCGAPGYRVVLSADVIETVEVGKTAAGGLGAASALGDDAAAAGGTALPRRVVLGRAAVVRAVAASRGARRISSAAAAAPRRCAAALEVASARRRGPAARVARLGCCCPLRDLGAAARLLRRPRRRRTRGAGGPRVGSGRSGSTADRSAVERGSPLSRDRFDVRRRDGLEAPAREAVEEGLLGVVGRLARRRAGAARRCRRSAGRGRGQLSVRIGSKTSCRIFSCAFSSRIGTISSTRRKKLRGIQSALEM